MYSYMFSLFIIYLIIYVCVWKEMLQIQITILYWMCYSIHYIIFPLSALIFELQLNNEDIFSINYAGSPHWACVINHFNTALMHSSIRERNVQSGRKQFVAIFWEIQFGGLDGAGGSGIVHILYAVRKGTAMKRDEEERERRGVESREKNAKEWKECEKMNTRRKMSMG